MILFLVFTTVLWDQFNIETDVPSETDVSRISVESHSVKNNIFTNQFGTSKYQKPTREQQKYPENKIVHDNKTKDFEERSSFGSSEPVGMSLLEQG